MNDETLTFSGRYTGGEPPVCHDDVCITCSDQMLQFVVESIDETGTLARGSVDGAPAEIGVELIDGVSPGDVLLCHGGVALQRLDPSEVTA